MFTVLTEMKPTRYWLVCDWCRQRWSLLPEEQLIPQTRRIMAQHQLCGGPASTDPAVDEVQGAPPG